MLSAVKPGSLLGRATHRRGLTLVSTLVGVALTALLLITNIATMIYTARASRVISYRLAARSVVQGVLERMFAFPYDDVTQANYDLWLASEPDVRVLDSLNGLLCDLTIEIVGEMQVTAASSTSLTVAGAGWEPNTWVGDTVFIVGGRGQGQRARIVSNTVDTLNTQLIGYGQPQWISTPDATSRILINGGKTIRVTAAFDFRGQMIEESVEGLVVNDG